MATKITRSPRAPSLDLDEAVRKAQRLLEKEGKHAVPADLAVKHMGYSGINNGSAARAIATLKAFGLVDSTSKGDISASKDIETYVYAPDESVRQELVTRWLRTPKVYADLLDEYSDRLPSDQAIRYRLIKAGFLPPAADECIKNFKASISFARYYERSTVQPGPASRAQEEVDDRSESSVLPESFEATRTHIWPAQTTLASRVQQLSSPDVDRIPVRLSRGRKAAIEVPTPLYAADKEILKRQIDLLFTDDDPEA